MAFGAATHRPTTRRRAPFSPFSILRAGQHATRTAFHDDAPAMMTRPTDARSVGALGTPQIVSESLAEVRSNFAIRARPAQATVKGSAARRFGAAHPAVLAVFPWRP